MASFPTRDRLGPVKSFFRIILLGDFGTGKTSLMLKYTQSDSDESNRDEYILDTWNKIIYRDEKEILLEIRDTTGMERYRSLTSSHYRGISGALVLFDLTAEKSFSNVSHWFEELKRYTDRPERVQVVLVGTRCHKKDERKVSSERITELAKHHDAASIEISVEKGINITETFNLLVDRVLNSHPDFGGAVLPTPSDGPKVFNQRGPQTKIQIC